MLSDEIVDIAPIVVSGRINDVNQYGQSWVTSDVQIDAMEQATASRSNMIQNVVSFQLRNVSYTSLQQRTNAIASYMVHDPERDGDHDHPEEIWRGGLQLMLCLKLSTRTNCKGHQMQKQNLC